MSRTAIRSLVSVTRKFFMNATHNMSKKLAINRFLAQKAKMSLTAISSIESGRRTFFMNATHNMCKNLESNVFRLRRLK